MLNMTCVKNNYYLNTRSFCQVIALILLMFQVNASIAQTQNSSSDINSPLPVNNETNPSDKLIESLLQRFANNGAGQLYDGIFVYLFEDQVQTFKVQRHINDKGQVVEHFQPQDDIQKSSSRILENQFCALRNGWKYQFQALSSSFPFRVNDFYWRLKRQYDFSFESDHMVAGKPAILLSIKARDALRYSYQLWFEPDTATLLKYRLSDDEGKVIEQYLFTEIQLSKAPLPVRSETQINHQVSCFQKFSGMEEALKQFIELNDVPDSYEPISYRNGTINDSHRQAHQFQFSDGLSTVSVFIEDQKKVNKKINGVVKIGPMSVAGKSIGAHQVTVLGAIPVDGALQFLDSIKR